MLILLYCQLIISHTCPTRAVRIEDNGQRGGVVVDRPLSPNLSVCLFLSLSHTHPPVRFVSISVRIHTHTPILPRTHCVIHTRLRTDHRRRRLEPFIFVESIRKTIILRPSVLRVYPQTKIIIIFVDVIGTVRVSYVNFYATIQRRPVYDLLRHSSVTLRASVLGNRFVKSFKIIYDPIVR